MNEAAGAGRHTQIIATIGPASSDIGTLGALAAAGIDVARLNFSHASHDEVASTIKLLRSLDQRVAVLGDLQGPKLRIGDLATDLELIEGTSLTLTTGDGPPEQGVVPVDPAALGGAVTAGTHLYLKDGTIELEVIRRSNTELHIMVRDGGTLTSRAGLNIPDVDVGLPALTKTDREDLAFAVEHGIEWLALSFVQRADDLLEARAILEDIEATPTRLVAKIERRAALDDLTAIAHASDGLMVARGDLGVEVGVEEVPIWQHRIIATGRRAKRPVIVATEMLESMRTRERPSRAEASDVAYAVWDGAAALLLSAETAVGQYPVRTVAAMDRIIRRAETELREDGFESW